MVSAEGGICGHLITMLVCLLRSHISIRDIISPPCECGSETRVPAVATRHTCWSFSDFCLPFFVSVQNICFSEAYSRWAWWSPRTSQTCPAACHLVYLQPRFYSSMNQSCFHRDVSLCIVERLWAKDSGTLTELSLAVIGSSCWGNPRRYF